MPGLGARTGPAAGFAACKARSARVALRPFARATMFHPLPIFVGLRYVRTRRQGFFVSFISWVSMLGVCLGVAALITIISVMNGFEGELRNRLVALTAHATLEGPPELMEDWAAVAERASTVPGTAGVAPFADVQAMIGRAGQLQPVLLHGLDPAAETRVSTIEQHLLQGQLQDLVPGERRMIIGRVLAWQLGAEAGDEITVMVPGRELISSGGRPLLQTFTVVGRLRGRPAGPRRLAGAGRARGCGGPDRQPGAAGRPAPEVRRRDGRAGARGDASPPQSGRARRCATGPRSTRPTSARSASRRR